jgi:hypothetical protein
LFAKILHEIGPSNRGRGVASRSAHWRLASIGMMSDLSLHLLER